ncbi:FAD-dependent oxidoreductase [Phenylobacterium sp.]|uniref:NAD(P)/FAD-dependent oxidoreductase n=1 Tax=Phenylobacterium sp. TaxID=1871053 RepID=UPI0025CF4DFC|nr:FAD-dependent oxidoreductase [Phenylobacterium sp.]MCA6285179.1 FAD-dependent oxidoreductase [Phenylobacterium sp.]MCA6287941.1 FAD-dependent oxidoreductase [Phenylobacterium sp.]MCA6309212.1 FAD-dependent oxidoreductase [Phenylobacterium sp.]MCA6322866.1 FAD-dependent oxidoreductase [Phenylobacterium sp.]MCA6336773.1 FAD-dependent oxidoreductase [Phenylobacterium sp.]
MTSPDAHVVIVGAGHAGGTLAALLRQYGHAGPVTLVGEEPIPPYQRPPLSKAWLKGEADAESLALKPLEFYAENRIDFRPSVRAERINRQRKVLALSDGTELAYDFLVLATGARPIRLPIPGADLEGILELRTAADAEALKGALGPGRTMAVVGGGYIGLEAAASARALGAEAVVLEREPRILARVAGEVLSSFFRTLHEGHGVRFLTGASVTGFRGEGGKVTGVELADGRVIACDLALVGVGAVPNQELAQDAGLAVNRGVVVDLEARTSDPSIFAIGDVTLRPMPIYGRDFRMESVPNALEQAKQAACAITGRPAPAGETPWQWSDQYDIKLQIAGYNFDSDQTLVRGDPASGRFAIFHLQGDKVQAVEAINSPPEFMMGRQLIGSRRPVDKQRLADPSISMKEVAAA